MAEQLEEFDFNQFNRARHYKDRYPYSQWFDGSIWKLTREVDFPKFKNSGVFRRHIYNVAKRKGVKIRTMIVDENTIVIQRKEEND
jgi:hypothetical protein